MAVPIANVPFREAVAVFRRFGFEVISRRHRGRGSQVERAGIDVTAFLWALGRDNRHGHSTPRGWRPGMPAPEGEQDRG